jgi:hypothetical protein
MFLKTLLRRGLICIAYADRIVISETCTRAKFVPKMRASGSIPNSRLLGMPNIAKCITLLPNTVLPT